MKARNNTTNGTFISKITSFVCEVMEYCSDFHATPDEVCRNPGLFFISRLLTQSFVSTARSIGCFQEMDDTMLKALR
jgi:hypothetical protein